MSEVPITLPLVCPHCGFRIFNRRYPKCESCGRSLPEGIAYSTADRAALLKKEEKESAQVRPRDGSSSSGTGDNSDFYWGGGDTSSGSDCSVGGDCGGGGGE